MRAFSVRAWSVESKPTWAGVVVCLGGVVVRRGVGPGACRGVRGA